MKYFRVTILSIVAICLIVILYRHWEESQKDVRMLQKATELIDETMRRDFGRDWNK